MSDKSYFDQRVGGQVRAEIVLDENGKPISSQGTSRTHYKINLYLDTPNPDVQAVTYKLDPTYYDPVRESTDASAKFRIELTTYGDYPVTVDAQVGTEIVRKVVGLSELLGLTYGAEASPAVQAALENIKKN